MKIHVAPEIKIILFLLSLSIYLAFGVTDFGLSFETIYWLVIFSTSTTLFFGGALIGFVWGKSKNTFSAALLTGVVSFLVFDYFYYDVDFAEYSETPESMEFGLLVATIVTFPFFWLQAYLGAKFLSNENIS